MATVNLWNSRPGGRDDCVTGVDDIDLEVAEAAASSPDDGLLLGLFGRGWPRNGELWVQVLDDGVETYVRQLRKKERTREPTDTEFAMQQGMAFGVDAYNEAMGWECYSPEDEPQERRGSRR